MVLALPAHRNKCAKEVWQGDEEDEEICQAEIYDEIFMQLDFRRIRLLGSRKDDEDEYDAVKVLQR